MSEFVLVHGAMHGSWCWKPVAELLNSAGHRVSTPTLTGQGERANELTRKTGVADHLDDVSSVIVENAHDRKRSRLYALRSAGHRRNT